MIQRRTLLLHTSLKTKRRNFSSVANTFATASPDVIHRVLERVVRGDFKTAYDDEERRVLKLMQEVRVINSHVPGSSAARIDMLNQIRAMITQFGMPTFFITINPADVYNPLVKFLAGSDIDIDQLLPEQVPNYWEQALLVARNPVVAAKFFNIYMKAFIHSLLGCNANGEHSQEGIFGVVKVTMDASKLKAEGLYIVICSYG